MSLASPRSICSYPRHFTLITRTAPVLAPATLAALPSTRAIPDRDVFYVARPASLHSYFFLLTSYFPHRAWKQKSRRGIPAPGGFSIDSLTYASPRESSVGSSITAVVVSPWSA